jgi:hypothetical protein
MLTIYEFYNLIDEYVEGRARQSSNINQIASSIINHTRELCPDSKSRGMLERYISDAAAYKVTGRSAEMAKAFDKIIEIVEDLYTRFVALTLFDPVELVHTGLKIL